MLKLSITNIWEKMRQCYMSLICLHTGKPILLWCLNKWCNIYLCDTWQEWCYIYIYLHKYAVKLSTLKIVLIYWSYQSDYKDSYFINQCFLNLVHATFLKLTITTEKATKHIVASINRKWPHRPIFSALSICCRYLWIRKKIKIHWKYWTYYKLHCFSVFQFFIIEYKYFM